MRPKPEALAPRVLNGKGECTFKNPRQRENISWSNYVDIQKFHQRYGLVLLCSLTASQNVSFVEFVFLVLLACQLELS